MHKPKVRNLGHEYSSFMCVYTVPILTHHKAHLHLPITGKRPRSDLRAGTYLAMGTDWLSVNFLVYIAANVAA